MGDVLAFKRARRTGQNVDDADRLVRDYPTRSFQAAVERYCRALEGVSDPGYLDAVDVVDASPSAFLVDEWQRVQADVVYETARLAATPDGQRAACVAVVRRVFDTVDAHMRDVRRKVPRAELCEILTSATPATPISVR